MTNKQTITYQTNLLESYVRLQAFSNNFQDLRHFFCFTWGNTLVAVGVFHSHTTWCVVTIEKVSPEKSGKKVDPTKVSLIRAKAKDIVYQNEAHSSIVSDSK